LGRRGALVSLRVGQVLVFDEGGHRHRALRAAPKLGHYLADVPLDAILHCGISYAVVFIESRPFTRRLTELAGDSADNVLRQIQDDLLQNPERGSIVKGLGGIRKARMSNPARGKGKRGGYRYLHLYLEHRAHIHLLFLLDTGEQEDLSREQRKALRRMVAGLKGL
jgi:hypothetical protein